VRDWVIISLKNSLLDEKFKNFFADLWYQLANLLQKAISFNGGVFAGDVFLSKIRGFNGFK
jgi:hypothetical protein